MSSDEEFTTPLLYLKARHQHSDAPQYPMLSGISTMRAPTGEEVCGEKRKSEDHGEASGKKRKKKKTSGDLDFSASAASAISKSSKENIDREKDNDAQEAGDVLSPNTSTQIKGHKSTEKHKAKAERREERESSKRRGRQHSHSAVNDAIAGASTSTHDAQAADLEKLEQRRRLDEIVKDHIDDWGIVTDRPGAKENDADWMMMSGGLVTAPLEVQELWDIRNPVSGDLSDGSELKVTSQETYSSVVPSTSQASVEASSSSSSASSSSSSGSSTTVSSPTLHTKQSQRRQSGNFVRPTKISGPLAPRFSDRTMPAITPTFAPTTILTNTQAVDSNQEEADEEEDEYYTRPGAPQSYTQPNVGLSSHRPSTSSHPRLGPASYAVPQPIDDLVTLVGVPGVESPSTRTSNGGPSSFGHYGGQHINRQVPLVEALARDRAVLEKEKELWTRMIGF
ncbi:uncharacterized protein F4812DRAFT_458170 [Daldinia caldariorum]|uniref:uncharacterized protein n=1 Tax=Daldinia caldariorum TaxID=326644 RepID=UPI0020081152|nr:uncharacterized protein F4812DRAFT_458170 [Daldinia caldariorum]KAI1468643.1 hypothetical protein F4812DRAFT_458170 [Daldinia caldariorum]